MLLLSSCAVKVSKTTLFQNYTGRSVPVCFEDFQGMGREAFPDFLSWGCFTYLVESSCLEEFYLKDTFKTVKDQPFEQMDCRYFSDDLSFYQEAIDAGLIQQKYDCTNKIYFYGIKYPYVHDILYDTVSLEVVHLVSTIRD